MIITPHCLICFLDDDFQSNLRSVAQSLSERHEQALRIYSNRFWSTLDELESVSSCPAHNRNNEDFTWWVDKWKHEIQTNINRNVIDSLINAYEDWICGHYAKALNSLDTLMQTAGLNTIEANRFDKALLFRGRKGRFISEDLFHIPFNKRHCISNQRYSLPGQPLLYLGLSVLDVAYEIGADPFNIKDYSFCFYWLRDPSNCRILDLGNRSYDLLWNTIRPITVAGSRLKHADKTDPHLSPASPVYLSLFVSFILAAMCSFRRKRVGNEDAFAPEYVLPQMLAHWARINNFNGILYTSTRVEQNKWTINEDLRLNRYRENLAFFTKYSPTSRDEYDYYLLNQFEISPTVQFDDVDAVSSDAIDAIRRQIIQRSKAKSVAELSQWTAIDIDTAFEGLMHIEPNANQIPYSDTPCGKLQRYLQYLFMTRQLVRYL